MGRISVLVDARPVVAFPADQPVFDEGDGEALGCEANCRGRAAGAAAYHHRVGSVGSAHEFSSTVVTSPNVSAHLADWSEATNTPVQAVLALFVWSGRGGSVSAVSTTPRRARRNGATSPVTLDNSTPPW